MVAPTKHERIGPAAFLSVWENLGVVAGEPVDTANTVERTVQVGGLFDGNLVQIEGSVDGQAYHLLTSQEGLVVSFTKPGQSSIRELVRYLRPRVTGTGAKASITVSLLVRGR